MAGRLIYVMGASGAGKDTVLQGLTQRVGARGYLAPRLITRPPTQTERGAISVSEQEFERLENAGDALAMAWRANGLAYGIPADIHQKLAAGCDVFVNGSRAYLPEARRRYSNLQPVLVIVNTQALLARLQARGRESEQQIHARLARNTLYTQLAVSAAQEGLWVIDNSGSAEDAVQALYQQLYPVQSMVSAA